MSIASPMLRWTRQAYSVSTTLIVVWTPPHFLHLPASNNIVPWMNLWNWGKQLSCALHKPTLQSPKRRNGSSNRIQRQPHAISPHFKACVLHARPRVRRFGHNTLARAALEALRSWRQASMLERGTICGYRGKRIAASQKARFLSVAWIIGPFSTLATGCFACSEYCSFRRSPP